MDQIDGWFIVGADGPRPCLVGYDDGGEEEEEEGVGRMCSLVQ